MCGLVSVLVLVLMGRTMAGPLMEEENRAAKDNEDAQWRDSVILPLLLNPFQITKLTCGSVITFYDAPQDDATVAVDVCLTALLVAKLIVVIPFLLESLNNPVEGGLFGLLDKLGEGLALAKLDLAGTGPEGEAFDFAQKKYTSQENNEAFAKGSNFHNTDADFGNSYVGFGFDGWQSGVQGLVDWGASNNQLPRGFGLGKLETYLRTTLSQLEKAVTVTHNENNEN